MVKRALILTGGDWERINFEVITNDFNAGATKQVTGTALANEDCDKPSEGFHQRRHLFKDRDALIRSTEDVEARARATKSSIEKIEIGTQLFQNADFTAYVLTEKQGKKRKAE